jgi:phenol hydroxylase P0 protein
VTAPQLANVPAPAAPVYWVRVTRCRADGFVEFDFAIGDPELSVDLILPAAAFEEFCVVNRVRRMNEAQGRELDRQQSKWRYGQAGVTD